MTLAPRWRKILNDLWAAKIRTALVVLSIAVGIFAVGMVAGTQVILTRDMQASYLAIDPPAAILGVSHFDDDLVQAVRHMPKVAEAEGRAGLSVRLRVALLEQEIAGVEGVARAEPMAGAWMRRLRPDGTESDDISLNGTRVDNDLIHPTLLAGRWLVPGDERAVVVSTDLLRYEPDLAVGGDLVLTDGDRERTWRIVGVYQGGLQPQRVFMSYDELAALTHQSGRARWVQVVTEQPDPALRAEAARRLNERLAAAGVRVSSIDTIDDTHRQIDSQFGVVVIFLLIMALLLAVVGGLGLMGTMSINVLERIREIGVLRAIGATHGAILRLVIAEGVLISVISWGLGAMLAVPLSLLLCNAVGVAFIQMPLDYAFSTQGVLVWLGIVVAVGALASLLPAWNAARLTVRDVLAYEG